MKRILMVCLFILSTGGSLTARAAVPPAPQPDRPPNIVILFPDQLRWAALGCYGDPVIRSPNMDRLAAEGVRFTHAFSNNPVCSPARSVLLSGRYACANGVVRNQDQEAKPGRPTNRSTTIAEALGAAGYTTALVGKWHLAPTPAELGFQQSLRPRMRHRYFKQTYYRNEGEPYIVDEYSPHHETRAAIRFIHQRHDRPFLLYLSYGPPHMPVWEQPEKYRAMYDPAKVPVRQNVWQNGQLAFDENWFKIYMWDFQYYENTDTFKTLLPAGMNLRDLTALYYGQITAVDDCIGEVLGAIRAAGIEEDTIVLLTSDHGDHLGSHGLFNKNHHYDEASRIPLIVRYPHKLKPAVIDTQVASLVDLAPTLLDLCGVKVSAEVQGTSLASVLAGQGKSVGENAAFIETSRDDGIRTKRYVYYRERNRPRQEHLFDVEADPYELNDLAAKPGYSKRGADETLRPQTRSAWSQSGVTAAALQSRAGETPAPQVLEELRNRVDAWRARVPREPEKP